MSNKTKLWTLGVGVICIILLLFGIFGGLLPQLQKVRSTASLADDAELMNDVYRAQITQLQKQEDNLAALEAEQEELTRAIPSEPMSEALLAELHEIAERTGATLQSYSAGGAENYTSPTDAETTEEPAAPNEDEATGPATDGAVDSEPGQVEPQTPEGLIAVPVTFGVEGAYDDVVEFFRTLQTSERLFFVDFVDIAEQSGGSDTFYGTMSGHMFVKLS